MTAIIDRAARPYLLPRTGEPLRTLFVGRESRFGANALHAPAGRVRPAFLDVKPGMDPLELLTAIQAAEPHVVAVFDPATLASGLLRDVRAATLGLLPSDAHGNDDGAETAADAMRCDEFDRMVAVNPGDTACACNGQIWRSLPLPVDDRCFLSVRRFRRPPRALFLGDETPHRESLLIRAKHEYDLLHYAHGLWGAPLREVLDRVDVGINVHRERDESTFDSVTLLHLAAGHLLLSEPLRPLHGLEPGIDFLTFENPDELLSLLFQLRQRPDMHERIRLRGRAKADDYRASRVWPRIIEDLILDIAAFATERRAS